MDMYTMNTECVYTVPPRSKENLMIKLEHLLQYLSYDIA